MGDDIVSQHSLQASANVFAKQQTRFGEAMFPLHRIHCATHVTSWSTWLYFSYLLAFCKDKSTATIRCL